MTGEVLLLRLNVTVQLVKELIRFCACELIICGVTTLEAEGPDESHATGMGFGVLFTKAVAVRLRLLHPSHLKTGYFCDQ